MVANVHIGNSFVSHPSIDDSIGMWQHSKSSTSSPPPGAYIPWCRDFWSTSAVAKNNKGEVLAFVIGYMDPHHRGTYVVVELSQATSSTGPDPTKHLLEFLADKLDEAGISCIEVPDTQNDRNTKRHFQSLAQQQGWTVELPGTENREPSLTTEKHCAMFFRIHTDSPSGDPSIASVPRARR